jgi:hypothetical protein
LIRAGVQPPAQLGEDFSTNLKKVVDFLFKMPDKDAVRAMVP